MTDQWKNDQPIYLQLKEQILAMILDGILAEGDALPSVRNVAVEYQINPITASKAYGELVEDGLVERRRGLGMFILKGARKQLITVQQKKFLEETWPATLEKISRLDLNLEELVRKTKMPETKS